MYKIGEFSYLCETTIKTLRHYDKINLLKPTKVDYITGYRYYEKNQITIFNKIKNLQTAGFKLNEIKILLKESTNEKIEKQIEAIKKEFSTKINILNNMKKSNNKNPLLIINPKYQMIGKLVTIKNRKDIPIILSKFPKELNHLESVFISFEKGYKEENIKAFIGKVLDNKINTKYDFINKLLNKGYISFSDNQPPTYLYIETNDLVKGYKKIIEYANKENFQIRGPFQEITTKNTIKIYVEAYDLKVENKDTIKWANSIKEKLKTINSHPKEFIGTWILQGEIIELPNKIKYKDEHYLPQTIYKKIILKKDGSTNFKNITWNDKYLVIKENNHEYYSILKKPKKKLFNTYMEVLINQKETNSRPYLYYYKKGKINEKI